MNEPIQCPVCLGKLPDMRDFIVHLLIWCLPASKPSPAIPTSMYDMYDHCVRTCWCGMQLHFNPKTFEECVMAMKEHITGRRGCGVTTANITREDILRWRCLNDYLMGASDG
jgi:hypothetical protein